MKRQQDLDHSPRSKRSRGYSSRDNLMRERVSPDGDPRGEIRESRPLPPRMKRDLSPSPPPPHPRGRSDYDYDIERASGKRRSREVDPYYGSRGMVDRTPPDYPPLPPRMDRDYHRGPARPRSVSPDSIPLDRDMNEFRSLCVSKIDPDPSDVEVKDALIPIFKRYGEFNIKIVHMGHQRLAYINFRFPDDAQAALHDKPKFLLFDCDVRVEPVYPRGSGAGPGSRYRTERMIPPSRGNVRGGVRRSLTPEYRDHLDAYSTRSISPPPPPRNNSLRGRLPRGDDRPPIRGNFHQDRPPYRDHHHDNNGTTGGGQEKTRGGGGKEPKFPHHLIHIPPEEDDKATRTLFVGNLDIETDDMELYNIFERYGCIEDVDIKRPMNPNQGNAYAFIRFLTLDMAYRAKSDMSGQHIGRFQCKIGYGKVTPTTCLWVGSLGPWVTLETLEREFDRFGVINKIEWTAGKNYAYVLYDSIDAAQAANQEMRGFPLGGPDRRLRIDFANPEFIDPAVTAKLENPTRDAAPPGGVDGVHAKDGGSRRRDPNDRYRNPDNPTDCGGPPPEYGELDENCEGKRTPMPDDNRGFDSPLNNSRERGGGAGGYNDRDAGSPRRRSYHSSENLHPDSSSSSRKPKPDDVLKHVTKFSELVKCLPMVWSGVLVLKNSGFPSRMHLVRGDMKLVDSLMKDHTAEVSCLRITQRLRLDQPKLEDVGQRISAAGPHGHCILLAVPTSSQPVDESIQQRPLKNLVSYLKQKDAAGVVTLPPSAPKDKDAVGVLHAFPPCHFGHEFLYERAPNLGPEPAKDDHVVIVVVKGPA
ncbi:RNA-binding protein spenito-like [Tubulanus polymorphus]|uniref:RNA-binding protein spenito-like n=1 Tax=Tubulanus polymorphus TaxID=672921 RepID=UPI003DA6C02C